MTVGMGAALGEIHAGRELRKIQRRLHGVHLQPQQRLQARPRPGDHPRPARSGSWSQQQRKLEEIGLMVELLLPLYKHTIKCDLMLSNPLAEISIGKRLHNQ
ncbi:hypothetical protein EJB05_09729 [Eragrostis curvula]|uniref:Uncharacterized protein n=1 Tax=Eragrostis curvula TaxID=38414 RepID=A0A5J9W767_9POAL|nr:hypothetical protein EJB05_09729 [Eragrostis curvula]